VIVDRDTDDLAGAHQTPRQLEIVPARLELTAGVVVKKQDRGRAVMQRSAEEIGRIDGRLGAGAEAEFVAADQSVAWVDAEETEDLAALDLQAAQKVLADNRRIAEDFGFSEPGARDPMTELEAGEDDCGLRRTDPIDPEKLGRVPTGEFGQATGRKKQGVGFDHRTAAAPAGPRQDRQQLSIRQDGWAKLEQPLTRP